MSSAGIEIEMNDGQGTTKKYDTHTHTGWDRLFSLVGARCIRRFQPFERIDSYYKTGKSEREH